jgi:rare lipoprotein A
LREIFCLPIIAENDCGKIESDRRVTLPAARQASPHRPPSLARFLLQLTAALLLASGCAHRTQITQAPGSAPTPSSTSRGSRTPPASIPSGAPPPAERMPAIPGVYVEEGVASWYGDPFNGRRAANGEIYDMYQLTAAHRTLPFNSIVRVTNLATGKQTQVRINDRGPFVANRIIDLSLSAARAIDMLGPGTAQVRLEVIGGATNPTAGFFGVQVGAFLQKENADKLRDRLAVLFGTASVVPYDSPNGTFYRVRVGRVPSEDAASQLATQLHDETHATAFVIRLDP